eukprot:TRINITY_DN7030_c2_g1_i2.p1 TRINITY_DN7030_c2_g1~~TRINITY_DN7030_c2_g1_i2.p1  ORF type:complete len:448 (+),score=154.14 TRINITY_DN7030_c2_g1_i2:61-1344(+)
MAKDTRLGRPPERKYNIPSQDIMPMPVDGAAHPEGLIELDSQAEQRWWSQMNEQRESIRGDTRTYSQKPDVLVASSMQRSKENIMTAWVNIQEEAFLHVQEVSVQASQTPSHGGIQPYTYGGPNFRRCSGVSLDVLARTLAQLWMYRWLCSAYPYNPKLDRSYMSLSQYAAVLMEEAGFASAEKGACFSESPAQPVVSCISGRLQTTMSDEEYAYAKAGVGRTMGFVSSPPKPLYVMLDSFMHDSDAIDVGSLPHRRWMLSPGMEGTGFGTYYSSSNMYAVGSNPDRMAEHMGDFIAYPAPGWFPTRWMQTDAAWSCSLNPEKYWIAPNATVTMWRTHIDQAPCGCGVPEMTACPLHRRGDAPDGPYEQEFSRLNASGFGGAPCLVFRPQYVDMSDGAAYEILIQGIWAAGERTTLKYIVRFFDMPE